MRLSSEIRVDSAQKLPDSPKTARRRDGGSARRATPARQWTLGGGIANAYASPATGAARTSATGRMPSSAASGEAGSASSPSV